MSEAIRRKDGSWRVFDQTRWGLQERGWHVTDEYLSDYMPAVKQEAETPCARKAREMLERHSKSNG